jgi:hypothetical protein
VQLTAVLAGEVQVSQQVLGGVGEQLGGLGEAPTEHLDDLGELRHGLPMGGLDEDRAHDRGHGVLGGLGDHGQQVPHEVDPAPLPGRSGKHLVDRGAQPLVGIGDHQANALQPAPDEATQERQPERVVLRGAGPASQHRPVAAPGDPDGHDGCDQTTRPAFRTLWNVASSHT